MAHISTRQNHEESIKRLAAHSWYYSQAKCVCATQAALAGFTPFFGAVSIRFCPETIPWVAIIGIMVALLNRLFLDRFVSQLRLKAAQIHEDFDCRVLKFPWNEFLAGKRPRAAKLDRPAKKFRPADKEDLRNWYPPIVDSLPIHQARIVCQWINFSWDAELRRQYKTWIKIAIIVVVGLITIPSYSAKMNLQDFVLYSCAPLLPSLLWGFTEVYRLEMAAVGSDRLRGLASRLLDGFIQGVMSEDESTRTSREIQNAILLHRIGSSLVFNWIYRLLRSQYEEQATVDAKTMVEKLLRTRER